MSNLLGKRSHGQTSREIRKKVCSREYYQWRCNDCTNTMTSAPDSGRIGLQRRGPMVEFPRLGGRLERELSDDRKAFKHADCAGFRILGAPKQRASREILMGRSSSASRLRTNAAQAFAGTHFRVLLKHAQTLVGVAKDAGRTVITAVSVSVGGPLKIEEGFLINPPHLPGWHGVDLKVASGCGISWIASFGGARRERWRAGGVLLWRWQRPNRLAAS